MSEATDQVALFELLTTLEGRYPLLAYAFHVPNGEKRDKATAGRLKAMGVKRGVLDLWLPVHNRVEIRGYRPGYFVGLVIEMKTANGRLTIEQMDWRNRLTEESWWCQVCVEWTQAARLLTQWVGGDPDDIVGLHGAAIDAALGVEQK